MCDTEMISKRTNRVLWEIDEALDNSKRTVEQVGDNMKILREKARGNMKRLSFLL
tara:strand:- start:1349 stop:1513 length:165 start_codon:yes stop_codon:yes gene_type:complete